MKVSEKIAVFFVLHLVWCCINGIPEADPECTDDFKKENKCLTFVTGKEDSPSKECCISVSDIKENDPVCLCFIIQQLHAGNNSQLKIMGILEARLLQLPDACNLHSAGIDECPELLNLAPNSTEAALFTNSSLASAKPSTASTTTSTTAGTSSTTGQVTGNGFKPLGKIGGLLVSISVAIFVSNLG